MFCRAEKTAAAYSSHKHSHTHTMTHSHKNTQAVPPHILKAAEKTAAAYALRLPYEEAVAAGKPADAGLCLVCFCVCTSVCMTDGKCCF